MKKLIAALMAFLFVASVSFAQPSTSVTKKRTKAKTHTTAHRTKKVKTTKPADTNTAETMRTPKSGMLNNGAGKTAKIQTTTKEKNDNLNDMDESRN